MVHTLWLIRDRVLSFLKNERAQDAFEYLLITGAVTTAIILAMVAVPGLITSIVSGVCNAIKALPNMGGLSC